MDRLWSVRLGGELNQWLADSRRWIVMGAREVLDENTQREGLQVLVTIRNTVVSQLFCLFLFLSLILQCFST